jgi:hypothetical protein
MSKNSKNFNKPVHLNQPRAGTIQSKQALRQELYLNGMKFIKKGEILKGLFTLFPLKGKHSPDVDKEIETHTIFLANQISTRAELLNSLSVSDLETAALCLKQQTKYYSQFLQVSKKLASCVLKLPNATPSESTCAIWNSLETYLGAFGFLQSAKLNAQKFAIQNNGDRIKVSSDLLSAGATFFLNGSVQGEVQFRSFSKTLVSIFFSQLQNSELYAERFSAEAENLICVLQNKTSLQDRVGLPDNTTTVLLSPTTFHSLPKNSPIKASFENVLAFFKPDWKTASEIKSKLNLYNETLFQNFLVLCTETDSGLENILKVKMNFGNFETESSEERQLIWRIVVKLLPQKNRIALEFVETHLSLLAQENSETMLNVLEKFDVSYLQELSFRELISTFQAKELPNSFKEKLVQRGFILLAGCYYTKGYNEILNWIKLCSVTGTCLDAVNQRLAILQKAEKLFDSMILKAVKNVFSEISSKKYSEKDLREFTLALVLNFHFSRLQHMYLSQSEKDIFSESVFSLIEKMGESKNVLEKFQPASWFGKKIPSCKCYNCLENYLEKASYHFEKHGLGLLSFPQEQPEKLKIFSQPPSVLAIQEFLNWELTPFAVLNLQPQASKAEVISKTMEAMKLNGASLSELRRAQTSLLDSEKSAFLRFFWDSEKYSTENYYFTVKSKIISAQSEFHAN